MAELPQHHGPDEEEQLPSVTERKHKIKRFRRRFGEHWYWVAEVWKPGEGKYAFAVMRLERTTTLWETTHEATRLVRAMIKNGGVLPATAMGNNLTFDARQGVDGFNPKSASGKSQWCEKHWAALVQGAEAGTHNVIVAGILLTVAFVDRVRQDGMITKSADDAYTMELLRDSYSPFCCWLGQEAVDGIMHASRPEEIVKSGILQELEKKLNQRRK